MQRHFLVLMLNICRSIYESKPKRMYMYSLCYCTANDCPAGFTGKYCDTSCRYPSYGYGCQQRCPCPRSHCHFSTGCHAKLTGYCLGNICIYFVRKRIAVIDKKNTSIVFYVERTRYLVVCTRY